MPKSVFNNFLEYWYYAKHFSEKQRNVFFNSIPKSEQDLIKISYKKGGWDCVFKRDIIDNLIDDFKKEYNIDLLEIRYKVLHNKSVYVPKKEWETINSELKQYNEEHIKFAIGGISAIKCDNNKDVVLLVKDNIK